MSVETLVNRIGSYNSDAEFDFLRRSYEFAEKAHGGQWRQSGEPYFTHCVATANVLTELKLDVRTVCAGLLHDVIEDTPVTREELSSLFGETIAQLVQGVSKIGRYKFRGGAQQRQAENYLKLLLATAEDIRGYSHQVGGPPTQHGNPVVSALAQTAGDLQRNARSLCSDCASPGHLADYEQTGRFGV